MRPIATAARRSLKLSIAVASVAMAVALPAQAAGNLIVNGSFETPTVGYERLAGGSTVITGWTTVLSGVEHSTAGAGGAADGVMYVDLANYTYVEGGGLEQAVVTTPGQRYELSFSAGNSKSFDRDGTGVIKVTLDGATTQSFDTAVAASPTFVWAVRSFNFVATGSSTVIRFWNDQDPLTHFAFVDGVGVVSSVPEAQSWAMLAAGLLVVGGCARRRLG